MRRDRGGSPAITDGRADDLQFMAARQTSRGGKAGGWNFRRARQRPAARQDPRAPNHGGLDLSLRSDLCDKSMTFFPQARRVEGDWI
jgi:hypothetical protein